MRSRTRPCRHCKGRGRETDPGLAGAVARKKRKAAGVTQDECAAILGCSQMFLSRLERGEASWTTDTGKAYLRLLGKVAP